MTALQQVFALIIAAGAPTTVVVWAATQVIKYGPRGPRTHP